MFTGLSAFPLTPFADDRLAEHALSGLIERLRVAGVDSITVLGSTGSFAYQSPGERELVVQVAVQHAGDIPVFVGVGALRTSWVLDNVARAEAAGASALLLAPMTYQPLTDDDVYHLFRTVTDATELDVIIYDNPAPPASASQRIFTNESALFRVSRESRSPEFPPNLQPLRHALPRSVHASPSTSRWASPATRMPRPASMQGATCGIQ